MKLHMFQDSHKWAIALAFLLAVAACGEKQELKPEYVVLAEYVSDADTLFPRVRYLADGLVSLNDKCPVRKIKLNRKMMAAYVNGHPVGFC